MSEKSPWIWSEEYKQHYFIRPDGTCSELTLHTQAYTFRVVHVVKENLLAIFEHSLVSSGNPNINCSRLIIPNGPGRLSMSSLRKMWYGYTKNHSSSVEASSPHSSRPGAYENAHKIARAPAGQNIMTREKNLWDVIIPWSDYDTGATKTKFAVALLDTQSQNGNWITWELLNKIQKTGLVHRTTQVPYVETALGWLQPIGTISIEMRRLGGNKYFDVVFWVGSSREVHGYEILLGQAFLHEHGVYRLNDDVLMPNLVEEKKRTPGGFATGASPGVRVPSLITLIEEIAEIEAREERRRLERDRLAANRG